MNEENAMVVICQYFNLATKRTDFRISGHLSCRASELTATINHLSMAINHVGSDNHNQRLCTCVSSLVCLSVAQSVLKSVSQSDQSVSQPNHTLSSWLRSLTHSLPLLPYYRQFAVQHMSTKEMRGTRKGGGGNDLRGDTAQFKPSNQPKMYPAKAT